MSQQIRSDAGITVIHQHDETALPPPTLEVGLAGWMRQNLFGSPVDIVVSAVSGLLILAMLIGFVLWAVRSANWYAIINNQRLFMMESFEPIFEWRLALTTLLAALLTGLSLAAWGRGIARALALFSLGTLALLAILPPLIEALIPHPPSYFTAGNVHIIDRASTLKPQENLAFIAQAGETVSVRLALDEVADLHTVSELAGFSDRATNALANAARNRLEQQIKTGDTFDSMLSGELTENLEERTRLSIRTFMRTNNMLAATAETVADIKSRLTAPDATVADLRYWLGRLERAAQALEPPAAPILAALETLEAAAIELSLADALPAGISADIDALSAITLASEQLEDLGETLVQQLTEDLIGEPDQADDDEELISPSPREAAFLRDLFVRLLKPQSVLAVYELGATPMRVAIRDAQTLDALAEGVLSAAGDALTFDIPQDGWYLLSKNAIEGEEGSAILAATGIYPIVQRTLSATESRYVRLTDNDLVVTASRPLINGKEAPFVVLIDNQFRGFRSLQTYLVHFIPPFFRQLEALFLPLFLTAVWGFALGRALAHLLGEQTVFSSRQARALVASAALSPLLIVIAYFVLLADTFASGGAVVVALRIAIAFVLVWLARRLESWLKRRNAGEDAEGALNRIMVYGWGSFPLVMFLLASGVGGLSGAALGSIVGGILWLLLMYFIGLHYRGTWGYALLLGGFFLQIMQASIINFVWDGWHSGQAAYGFAWLLLAGIGIVAGLQGRAAASRLSLSAKRFGYLICCSAFVLAFANINIVAAGGDANAPLLAGAALLLWLGWMFFSGASMWASNNIIVGLLLLTLLWLGMFTGLDRWSSIYFLLWLAAGAAAFKRGESGQADTIKPRDLNGIDPQSKRMAAVAAAWVAALLLVPAFVLLLDGQGVLQVPPGDLLPLSDKRLWGGLMLTMQLTILGIGASFPIGLALALGRRSNLPAVKYACILYIEVVRGVPLITLLFLATLVVPLVDPTLATIEQAVRAWVGITMFSAAYLAENVRGGLQSIDRGQVEAAQAIGLSGWQTTLHILLPQALRAVIPALVGQFISLFKDTSLVFIVGLAEIMGIAVRVVAQPEFLQRRQETFLYAAILFFVFSYIMSYISRRIEATGSGATRAQQL